MAILTKKTIKNVNQKGSMLVEALVSVVVISFVMISVFGVMTDQQVRNKQSGDKNIALFLAEQRMEEILKFPVEQMEDKAFTDYIYVNARTKKIIYDASGTSLNEAKQFRRTSNVLIDPFDGLATVEVRVEYGPRGEEFSRPESEYAYEVFLHARRSRNDNR